MQPAIKYQLSFCFSGDVGRSLRLVSSSYITLHHITVCSCSKYPVSLHLIDIIFILIFGLTFLGFYRFY